MYSDEISEELNRYARLGKDWDGEGAHAPRWDSIIQCRRFVDLLPNEAIPPEPMAHASGTCGLYWREERLYADLEFLKDDVVFYVEIGTEIFKGRERFNAAIPSKLLPLVNSICA